MTRETTKSTKKMTKRIQAICLPRASTGQIPKAPAMRAITRKSRAQRSMFKPPQAKIIPSADCLPSRARVVVSSASGKQPLSIKRPVDVTARVMARVAAEEAKRLPRSHAQCRCKEPRSADAKRNFQTRYGNVKGYRQLLDK